MNSEPAAGEPQIPQEEPNAMYQRRRPRGRISVALEQDQISRLKGRNSSSLARGNTFVDILESTKIAKAENEKKQGT